MLRQIVLPREKRNLAKNQGGELGTFCWTSPTECLYVKQGRRF